MRGLKHDTNLCLHYFILFLIYFYLKGTIDSKKTVPELATELNFILIRAKFYFINA